MTPPRFLVGELPAQGVVQLDADSAKHATSVLRLQVGSHVVLFDGLGRECTGTIEQIERKSVSIQVIEFTDADRELSLPVRALVALPKGDRQRALVDGLTQLGVDQLIPLSTQRGVAQPTPNAIERLRRVVIEASKQCGRNQLMEVANPISVSDIEQASAAGLSMFAHPYGESARVEVDFTALYDVQFAVGPEGGFTEDEVREFHGKGWQQLSLGPRILRIEMATLAIASSLSISAASNLSFHS